VSLEKPRLERAVWHIIYLESHGKGRISPHGDFPGAPDSPRSTFARSNPDLDASYSRGLVSEEEKAARMRGSDMAVKGAC
jgi:hypothetical protein